MSSTTYHYHPSAAARCLAIVELVHCIADELLDNGNGRGSVANMAATCRTFRDPAIAAVWRTLDSLVPLLRLVDKDDYWFRKINGVEAYEFISRHPDLSRIPHYARLVRRFSWNCNRDVCDEALETFFARFRDGPIFPRVRYLRCYEHRSGLYHDVLSMCVPRVSRGIDLQEFRRPLPPITYASLWPYDSQPWESQEQETSPWPNLNSPPAELLGLSRLDLYNLSVTLIQPVGLLALTGMRQLTELAVGVDCASLHISLADAEFEIVFPALKTLRLEIDTLDAESLKLMKSIQAPTLDGFSLTVARQPLASVLQQHLDVLTSATFAPSLTSFHVHCEALDFDPDDPDDPIPPGYTVTTETLRSLLRMVYLTGLEVRAPRIDLGTDFYETCARTFKLLQYLMLLPSVHDSGSPCVPLEALGVFAKHCPELLTLGFLVDGTRLPARSVGIPRKSKSCVEALVVCDSPIAQPARVAAFLAGLFPALLFVASCDPADMRVRREPAGWQSVNDTVRGFNNRGRAPVVSRKRRRRR